MEMGEISCGNCKTVIQQPSKCHRCNEIFCEECINFKQKIYSKPEFLNTDVQVCVLCNSIILQIQDFIDQYGLKWGVISQTGGNWLTWSGAINYKQEHRLTLDFYAAQSVSPEDEEMIERDVLSGRTDPETFNWQMAELLMRLEPMHYKDTISQVLRAFCVRNKNIGYCQGLNYIAVWLMIFMDRNSAFCMLSYLVERWLLPDFYIGSKYGNSLNGFYVESTVISVLMQHLMPDMQNSLSMKTQDFCDFFCLQHMIQLFVNTLDVSTTKFLWTKLSQEGSVALIKGVISLLFICEKQIKTNTHPLQITKLLCDQRLQSQMELMYDSLNVEINESRVERLRGQARSHRAKQWSECENVIISQLQHVSQFSKQEITDLQQEFNRMIERKRNNVAQRLLKSIGTMLSTNNRLTLNINSKGQRELTKSYNQAETGINRQEFVQIITKRKYMNQEWVNQLFNHFDEDRDGYLDFRELIICLSVLYKGSLEDKLKLAFEVFDKDGVGYLTQSSYLDMIHIILNPYKIACTKQSSCTLDIESIQQRLISLAPNPNSRVEQDQVLMAIRCDPLVHNYFEEQTGSRAKLKLMKQRRMGATSCNKCCIL